MKPLHYALVPEALLLLLARSKQLLSCRTIRALIAHWINLFVRVQVSHRFGLALMVTCRTRKMNAARYLGTSSGATDNNK